VEEDWRSEFAEADCYEVRGSVVAQQGSVVAQQGTVLAGGAIAADTMLGLADYPGEREPVRALGTGYVLALCYDTRHNSTIVAIAPNRPDRGKIGAASQFYGMIGSGNLSLDVFRTLFGVYHAFPSLIARTWC